MTRLFVGREREIAARLRVRGEGGGGKKEGGSLMARCDFFQPLKCNNKNRQIQCEDKLEKKNKAASSFQGTEPGVTCCGASH